MHGPVYGTILEWHIGQIEGNNIDPHHTIGTINDTLSCQWISITIHTTTSSSQLPTRIATKGEAYLRS
jgi:hypothetical protein